MDNVVVLSKRPFQVLAFMALVGATLFSVRIVLGYFSSFQILPPVTNALLLNALLAGTLLLLVVLSVMGEFVIRSFTTLRENPRYVIREALRREWEPHKVVGNAGTDVGAPGDREKATNPTKGDDSP
jgi:RsiW-degrading membrane proteinase PrsW (M82 family)